MKSEWACLAYLFGLLELPLQVLLSGCLPRVDQGNARFLLFIILISLLLRRPWDLLVLRVLK